ncbi:MAG: branched-chain amino acid ABC transporter permease, partial [Acetobacteraceae bacterium]
MVWLHILVDGFAISSLYALGAIGFTMIFGVSGVLNLAHGGTLVIAAMITWFVIGTFQVGTPLGALIGIIAAMAFGFLTYFAVVRPIQTSRSIPTEEQEIFILTATLLWGIMVQTAIAYVFTTNPVTVTPFIPGVMHILSVRTPRNEVLTAVVCWLVMGLLWLFISGTRAGKSLLAASVNPRALTLCGYELSRIHLLVWAIYGLLAGIAGVLLGTFLGA